jgi:hypothetical protein
MSEESREYPPCCRVKSSGLGAGIDKSDDGCPIGSAERDETLKTGHAAVLGYNLPIAHFSGELWTGR